MILYNIFSKLVKPLVGSGIGNIHFIADLYQKIMPKLLPESEKIVSIQGFRMKVLAEGHMNDIATELIFKGVHEPATTRIFKSILKQGDVVVDIGANIGYFTMLSAQLVSWRGRVYAFEPDPINMKALYENMRMNKLENIKAYMMALGNYTGTSILYTSSKESARHSLVKTKEHDGRESTLITKLDDMLVVDKPKIRLLKTDTEGNELAVLQGAKNTILSNRNIILIVEVNREALEACKVTVDELWNYITITLNMTYIYLVNDYNDSIELVYSPERHLWEWYKKLGIKKYGYNLLCSREELLLLVINAM